MHGGDGLHGVGAADGFCSGFRHAEVFHLAGLNEFLHRARDIFDWHIGINAMLIEQVDSLNLEPFKGAFDDLLDVCAETGSC